MAKRINLYTDDIYNNKVNKKNIMLLKDYTMELKSRGLSEKTIYQYQADIRGFFCWLYTDMDNDSILDLRKRDFRVFFLTMSENGTSAARINRFQSSLRNLLQFAVDDDDEYDYDANVMSSIKGIRGEPVKEIVFLTDDEINTILDHLLKEERYQEALYLSLSYDSAARRNEVWQVEKEDFEIGKITNKVIGKRGKKFALIYLDRTQEIAELYKKQRGEDDVKSLWVVGKGNLAQPRSYESLYTWVVRYREILKEDIGIYKPINPHSLRHSSLTNYENGTHYSLKYLGVPKLDLKVLKALAKHDSIETTQSYLPDQDEELLLDAFGLSE